MARYVIIGNGAAGAEAAIAIRSVDATAPITMITESRFLHYYRPKLIDFLAKDEDPSRLVVYDDNWYFERSIWNILERRVVGVDAAAKTVRDSKGGLHRYDKLLIATGSRPVVPPIPGIERPGVFTLRSVADAQKIKQYSAAVDDVVVIGGGLLGVENAHSLLQLGKRVTVVEAAPWLLPRQLDEAGGRHLQTMLEAKGLRFVVGRQVREIAGPAGAEAPVNRVLLSDGRSLDAGAVIVSVGIRGDTEFLKGTSIAMARGIVVDDYLQTSDPSIWAAGDAIEHRGKTYGLWITAREQGRIAGLNMAGQATVYEGSIPSSILKITGIDVFSMGDPGAAEGARAIGGSQGDAYRKLALGEDGQVVAAMVVGDRSAIQVARKVMQKTAPVEDFAKLLPLEQG